MKADPEFIELIRERLGSRWARATEFSVPLIPYALLGYFVYAIIAIYMVLT